MALGPVKVLLRLRWILTLRGLLRSRSALVGMVLVVLVLAPYSLGIAGGIGFGLWQLSPVMGEHLLRAALLALAAVWTLGPLLGFQLNEGHDITRLFVYPVPIRTLFCAAVLSCLFDTTTLLVLPSLLAVIVGVGHQGVVAGGVALVAMVGFLFQTLAASQAVTLALQGVLRSRRWRDGALLVVPLFWMVWQFGIQGITRNAGKLEWRQFLTSPFWEGLGFLPPGLVARALGAAMKGQLALSLAYLSLFGLVTVLTIALSERLVSKAYEGEEVGIPAPAPGTQARRQAQRSSRSLRLRGLSPVSAAVFEKEWRYFTRDPFFRLMAMNFLYMLALGAFMSLTGGRARGSEALGGEARAALGVWMGSSLLLFQQTMVFYNGFGAEANAAALLFAFPASRREILLGKNLAQLSGVIPLNLLGATLLCLSLQRASLLPVLLPWMLLSPVLMAAVGNGVSVLLPYRVNTQGLRARQQSTGYGMGYLFLSLLVTLASLVLYAPVLAAVLVPLWWLGLSWLFVTVPVAVLYADGLYFLSLRVAEPWLLEREAEIIAKVARPD